MAKFIGGLFIVSLLAMVGSTVFLKRADATASYVQDLWAITCDLSRYTCDGITLPKVVYLPLPGTIRGMYVGSNTVFLDSDLEPWNEDNILDRGILIHEMVHYLQTKEDGQSALIRGQGEWCIAEGEAYSVANRYFAKHDAIEHFVNWERGCK